jgi:catecholate siderophore receptor
MGASRTGKHRSLAAMMLAGSLSVGAQAQNAGQASDTAEGVGTLGTVVVQGQKDRLGVSGKASVRATESTIGKGKQKLRDIPQSVTVVTEKLLDDRHIDTVKEALKNTAGVTFLAAENGEEDIRLRGFSLAQTGDIFVDGMRDPAFYDRDTFNLDRMEVLRGSASMLFGRGSTGGAINQVSKLPRLVDEGEVDVALGSWNYKRATVDVNKAVGENTAVRVTGMATKADNNGAGSSINKHGIAAAIRTGIGEEHELMASVYYLRNRNGVNYGLPWLTTGPKPEDRASLPGLKPQAFYGMSSDRNYGEASMLTLGHVWRPDNQTELNTRFRKGRFERDMRASILRFAPAAQQPGGVAVNSSNFGPNTVFTRNNNIPKIQDVDTLTLQSDLSKKFEIAGMKHELQAGLEWSKDEKEVFNYRNGAQGGVDIAKPNGTFGQPGNNPWINEDSRVLYQQNDYSARSWGAYAQDMWHVNEQFKLVAGLRYDKLVGNYNCHWLQNPAAPATANAGCDLPGKANVTPSQTTSYRMNVSEWSPRLGFLYQPSQQYSWYGSYGQSFNPSGEAYSLSAANVNIDPEKSRNLELGVKAESADGRLSWRASVFRTTKYNERNTDTALTVPGTNTPVIALSGKRHATGLEFDAAGRITPAWEVYTSWMWIPGAKVDKAIAGITSVGDRQGDRPGLTPKLSGTVWSTYQINEQWRVGAGLNYRSKQRGLRSAAFVPAFTTADALVEYRPSEKWTVKGNISNLTNKYYADQLYPAFYVPGAGRNVQVTASYAF